MFDRKSPDHISRLPGRHWIMTVAALFTFALPLAPHAVSAQRPAKPKESKQEKDPALQPRPELLTTKDGLKITAYYFPSAEGKEGIPVMIVHEWKGQAAPYLKLCTALRDAGFAAIVVEYRGHGNSKTYRDRTGTERDFNISTMGKRDTDAIVRYDLEVAKQFLKEENNAGRLNLNALCMLGVEEGAILAGYWSIRDWEIPSVGRMKQGQDVKALVYVSPEKNLHGLAMSAPATDPILMRLPTMIVAGKSSSQGSESERMGSRLETMKKRFNRGTASGFEMVLPKTNLSGPALINDDATVIPKIVKFLQENVQVSKTQNPWIERP
ncbi:alpha/beta hydrolase [Allorhodopirellula solitaria]|uniref:Alpha/beta hydrolase family protein n=1 Tax=Allorhodopirellula solitaria TaxID=2527987 RepID=A0A5C5YH98_9BACT|nr:alpha/beta hydrolase [Allorhodopirellula solitaria]TWT73895.1 Alpha/beta hydrolase family protein [Allorhodopirellula solitaria]